MKQFKKIALRLVCLLCVLLCCTLLTACASAGKLSDDTISQLREKYPAYENTVAPLMIEEYSGTDTFADVKTSYQRDSVGVVSVTVLGINNATVQIAPLADMPLETMHPIFLQLHVDSVIAQKDSSDIKGNISVYVGLRENYGERYDFAPGTKLVIAIREIGKDFNPTYCPDGYASSMDTSFYLTDDDYLLSIYNYPGPKEMDGKPLSAFRSEVKNIFR